MTFENYAERQKHYAGMKRPIYRWGGSSTKKVTCIYDEMLSHVCNFRFVDILGGHVHDKYTALLPSLHAKCLCMYSSYIYVRTSS